MIKVRIKKLPYAKTGTQVNGALVTDESSFNNTDSQGYMGKKRLKESKYITAVPREEANLEAEGGETVYGDINGDGMPEHKIIKGPRHSSGGVPLSLPDDTFIFSDTKGMLIKDPKILAMFGKGGTNKSFTPAEIAKQYDIQKYRKILEDPDTDAIERKTAELMIKKYVIKLGCLALQQESQKGFPQGIPAVAKPCMEARGLTEEDILPDTSIKGLNEQLKQDIEKQKGNPGEQMNQGQEMEQAEEMNQGQPVAQSQQQMSQQPPSQEEMMRYGGGRRLRRAQEGMQQPSEEEMMMMQQQQQQQGPPQDPQQGQGQDQMSQIIQEVTSALERGADPSDVVMSLLENGLRPEDIVQIFLQLGASNEEASSLVEQVMSQSQGAQQSPMGQQEQIPQENADPRMSQEEMMRMGGMRRLKKGQEGMEQQGGQDQEMMQMLQQISQALEKGAEPQEIISQLLQSQMPPQQIEQIFVQLGMPQDQVKQLVMSVIQQMQGGQGQDPRQQMDPRQQQMSQEQMSMQEQDPRQMEQAPMAQYGMSMGGYDMPFYDIPEAAYGASMGSNMAKGNSRSNSRINLPKAPGGGEVTIDATGKTPEELDRLISDAYKFGGTDKKGADNVKIKRTDGQGKVTTTTIRGNKRESFINEGKDIDVNDLKGFPDTPSGRVAAAQYQLIEKNLSNPKVRAEIVANTKLALEDPKAYLGKNSAPTDPGDIRKTWTKVHGALPSDDEIIKQALNHQKRNLMATGYDVDPQLFNDTGNRLASISEILSKNLINPNTKPPRPYTAAELTPILADYTAKGYTSVAALSEKIGIPLDPVGKDRVLQQATMHSYAKSYQKNQSGAYSGDRDLEYAMDNFLGGVSMVHVGRSDEESMGRLYGPAGAKISPLDDKYDYANNKWYQTDNRGRLVRGKYTTYGNTTLGHQYMVASHKYAEDPDKEPGPGPCTCDVNKKFLADGTTPNPQYRELDPNGKCSCDEQEKKKCPCQKSDGTVIEMTPNLDGSCPPCEEPGEKPPAAWWLQDTIKTTGAFADQMGIKKYMPFAPPVALQKPRPVFQDPTRELGANAEAAKVQTEGAALFAGDTALSAQSSAIQGQQSKNAADILAKYNNANVNIANQFELKGTDIANQESMLKQANSQRLYDQNTVANQQFDNAKLAMRNQTRNYYTNAITNKWKTDALNQMYPDYAVDPAVGGRMYHTPNTRTPSGTTSGKDWQKAQDECLKENPNADSKTLQDCRNAKLGTGTQINGSNPNIINQQYQGQGTSRDGGAVYEDGGFVHISSWLPFLK